MKTHMLKIGELSDVAKVSQDTLRFYEKQGLLTPSARTEAGYRLYSYEDIDRVQFILSAKSVGFTLNEIQELLALEVTKDQQSCQTVKQFVDDKLDLISQRIRELTRIQHSLKLLSDACCGGDEPASHCTILQALNSSDIPTGGNHDLTP